MEGSGHRGQRPTSSIHRRWWWWWWWWWWKTKQLKVGLNPELRLTNHRGAQHNVVTDISVFLCLCCCPSLLLPSVSVYLNCFFSVRLFDFDEAWWKWYEGKRLQNYTVNFAYLHKLCKFRSLINSRLDYCNSLLTYNNSTGLQYADASSTRQRCWRVERTRLVSRSTWRNTSFNASDPLSCVTPTVCAETDHWLRKTFILLRLTCHLEQSAYRSRVVRFAT